MSIRLKAVEIDNFFRIKHARLPLGNSGFHLVYGENGSGKSSIFEALTWCLYGRCARGRANPGDDIVRPGSDDCKVTVVFGEGSRLYKVKRTRGESGNYLLITEGKQKRYDLRGKDVKESERIMARILGMDYETFCRTVYFPQGGIAPLGALSDAVLKEYFLERFFGSRLGENRLRQGEG